MPNTHDYASAGVSIDAGDALVSEIKKITRAQRSPFLMGGIGGFGGLFALPQGYREPILVASTDGVGTKLKIAFSTGVHDTIGWDLVAMSVNDILVCGAKPLFFLDYFATGKLDVPTAAAVIRGIYEACASCEVVLLGGETAELPGFYQADEYDLAGFAVGVVDRCNLPDTAHVRAGDVVIALPSSGLHSNGYSLARKMILDVLGLSVEAPWGDSGHTVGQELLTPTRIYVNQVVPLIEARLIQSMVHVTGGGLIENPPRSVPPGLGMDLEPSAWPVPEIFGRIQDAGVTPLEMARTFNCGLGFLMVVHPEDESAVCTELIRQGETFHCVGSISARPGEDRSTRMGWT